MTREEAQQVGEKAICDMSRSGKSRQLARERALDEYKCVSALFHGAIRDCADKFERNVLTTGDLTGLGALCVEFIREALLDQDGGAPS